ncbi:unnamed protein product [Blepharisma stoltei]|uniref:Kelch motif family protein n=1 Tax=Blepharisma stoltei TaxID=1481888 RepID=A0AAU9KAR4_9CILI|nr:unnamed protein product [Blepharisma stoltei]
MEYQQYLKPDCMEYQNDSSKHVPKLMQTYQNYASTLNQGDSLYLIDRWNNRTNLLVYNTVSDSKQTKILKTPEPLDCNTCIAQLPNGKLFCYGKNFPISGITLIIDENGGVQKLPSGVSCYWSSAIYFNNNVYCFGGIGRHMNALALSRRFDLDRNRWVELASMPQADCSCSSVIFNGNILISGSCYRSLLLYSIDIDSFSTIPSNFKANTLKILICAERRLYLIECDFYGKLYESDIGSYTFWRIIGRSASFFPFSFQVYWLYNAGQIYIGSIKSNMIAFFKFNLDEQNIVELERFPL